MIFHKNLIKSSILRLLINFYQIIFFLNFCRSSVTPTGCWKFSTPTTSTTTNDQYNSGNPIFYLDDNGSNFGVSGARYVGNGLIFEGGNIACTHSPAGTTIRNQGNFSVDFWAYVNIINSQSMIVCKFYLPSGGLAPNERFCIGFDSSGKLIVRMNALSYNSYNSRYTFSLSSCAYANGWNHVTVTINVQSYYTIINCYVQTDSGLVTTASYTWYDTIDDDPSNGGYLCAGGSVSNQLYASTGGFDSPFTGMVNIISFFYGTILSSSDVSSLYSTNCQSYCKICQISGSAPYQCLQQQAKYLQKYDFIKSVFPISLIQSDSSGNGFDLTVNQNFAFTPAYVHEQGLWFDTTFRSQNQYLQSVGSTKYASNVKSFTIEAWVRPEVQPNTTQNIFEKQSSPGTDYLQFEFLNNYFMQLTLNGVAYYYGIGIINLNIWHYMVVSVVMQNPTSKNSKICLKFDSAAQFCYNNYPNVFQESGTGTTLVGSAFNGYIRSIYVYDYAKEDIDFIGGLQSSGCKKNDNGNTCTNCPKDTGQCIVDCTYNQYVNSTTSGCTPCYANCRSCWGAFKNTCYSCTKIPLNWTYDYVDTCYSACGDGYRDDYEQCDDGNTISGDGCSSTCKLESGFSCFGGSFSTQDTCYNLCGNGVPAAGGCDDGNFKDGDGCDSQCNIETGWTCSGTPSTCTLVCGDGLRVGTELCDDGNTVSGDGCSNLCAVETGFNCTGGSVSTKDTCQEICGDGKDFGKYGCDDGNLINNDGCDQNCRVELGFTCSGGTKTTKDTCTEICGDGRDFHTYANSCDDGNTVSGDGCSSVCKIETGFKCKSGSSYTKDTCYEICGDGLNEGHVQCDDGNVVSGDGCHSDCTIEIGYLCSGGSSTKKDTCTEICGDGRNFGTLACDDGNIVNGDGCSSNCTVEKYYSCTQGDPYSPSVCIKTCDGIRDFTDMCDDGNMINGDGCDYCCHQEVGFSCSGGSLSSADTCTEACGDGRKMNILQCDDGNTISGDGCSSICSIETGFSCTGGTIFTPDICSELCGDGKNFGFYQCDDGNYASNDGCSSTCYIENGFTCTVGSPTTASVCKETCGDGKNMKSYINDCDDGNTKSGDGCSSTCLVETGFECSQGGFYTPDLCVEICGDGLNFGMFQCDDGNTQDGDGCSAYCMIEVGFLCSGGNSTSPDVCYGISNPVISSANFSLDNSQITLTFNETLLMNSAWTNSSGAWKIDIYGPLGTNNYQYYWDVYNQWIYKSFLRGGTKIIVINIKIFSQLYGNKVERVVISFNDRTQLKSYAHQVEMYNTSTTVYPYGQDDKISTSLNLLGLGSISNYLITALTLGPISIGLLGSFLGLSMMDVWIMMQGLQQIYLLPVNNLEVPTTLTNYIILLEYAMPQSFTMSQLCFGGAINSTLITQNNPSNSYTYSKMGFQSNASLQTGGDVLSLFVICIILCTSLQIIRMIFEKNKIVNRNLSQMISSIFLGYLTFSYNKLAFISHLNLKNFNFEDTSNSLSSILAIGIAIFLWSYMFYTFYQAYQFYLQIKLFKEQDQKITDQQLRDRCFYYGNIKFQDFSIESYAYPLTLFYPAIYNFKQLLSVILIISDNTVTQLQGQMILNILSLTTLLLIQPYQSELMNFLALLSEMQTLVLYIQAHYFIPKSSINQKDQQSITQNIVIFIALALSAQALIIIISKIGKIFLCKSQARERLIDNQNQKIEQQNQDSIKKSINSIKQIFENQALIKQNLQREVLFERPQIQSTINPERKDAPLRSNLQVKQIQKKSTVDISERSESKEQDEYYESERASRSEELSYDTEEEEEYSYYVESEESYQQNKQRQTDRKGNYRKGN